MKKIIFLFLIGLAFLANGQNAKVQFIHNSPDFLTEYVDIYRGAQKIVDSIGFREATTYMDVMAGSNQVLTIQSADLPDTVAPLFQKNVNFDADSTYVVVLSGLVSTDPYDSIKPFDIDVHKGREVSGASGKVDVLVYHGGTDGPQVSIDETTTPVNGLISFLGYGEFQGYLTLDPIDYQLRVFNSLNSLTLAEYGAPLQTLGLADSAIVVLASGLVDTTQSKPGDSTVSLIAPEFGLWAALPGGGPLVELPVISGIGLPKHQVANAEIYPVPADDYLYIKGEYDQTHLTAEVYNVNGKLMQTNRWFSTTGQSHRLNIADLSPGLYILKLIEGEDTLRASKIMIE